MCGICGVVSKEPRDVREVQVLNMNQAIYHRGPDEDGFFSNETCTLGMRRLSIIDLNTGKQPFYSDCGRYLIFFNGEIYNYRDLKECLLELSCVFISNTDTEVVVNLFKYFGKSMLSKLKGMFAFCIYDIQEDSYFFARDRFGEKPFFYYSENDIFIFSSEIRSLLSSNAFIPVLNKSKLRSYLRMGYVDEPSTLIRGVFTLPPGCYLELSRDRQISIESYFSWRYEPDNNIRTIEDATDLIKPVFEEAVKRQLVSDVPIGAFLSGGVDSSAIVATMAKLSDRPVKTFTVKFKTKGYDESKIARIVSDRFSTDHSEIVVENNQFEESHFWRIIDHVGLPFPDSSAIPTDMVTSLISKHVKVALSGDGGDEVFGGYNVFDWLSKINRFSKIPKGIRNVSLYTLAMANKAINSNHVRQFEKVLKIANLPLDHAIRETHALFDLDEVDKLLISWQDHYSFDQFDISDSLLRNSMRYRLKYDLPLDMLTKVDRMSMANSLEVRSPFLDIDLFDASCILPDQFIRQNGLGKLVIRKMMKETLPIEVFNHPKSGFSIPLHDFKNDNFKILAKELIFAPFMFELFNTDSLQNIYYLGLNDAKDNGQGSVYRKTHQLWSLMMLSGWIKRFGIQV